MSRIGRAAWRAVVRTENRLDRLVFFTRKRLGLIGPVHVRPYRGFGTSERVWLYGRVLVDRHLEAATEGDSLWKNFRMSYKRFASVEIPGAAVRLSMGDASEIVATDGEGYYDAAIDIRGADPTRLWHNIDIEYLTPINPRRDRLTTIGEVQIPAAGSPFGVISDVDDTIIRTEATSALTMMRLTLFHNAYMRKPFSGVSAFYRALQAGPDNSAAVHFFYVSSSPWNLYDLLVDVFDLQDLPRGTFFLRDLGLDETRFIASRHEDHKLAQIARVMAAYPDMQFVLIGDSGQKDPEIYRKVVMSFPGRVKVIYIRDVKPEITSRRDVEVHRIAEEVSAHGVEMVPVRDTLEAAHHAANLGLIDEARIPAIDVDRARDEGQFSS